jgi:hypothetical protein
MPRLTTQALLSLILTMTLIPGWAAGPAIGVAIAPGTFQIDGAPVTGNATLFDGVAVETAKSSSRLQVNSGVRVDLAPESRARVYAKYVALERGTGELASSEAYQIEARTLRIEPRSRTAVARVGLEAANTVMVAALNGPVRVFNDAGLVVADVIEGMKMSFVPQAGPANGSALAGCLTKKAGAYLLTDQASNVTVELRGDGLEENVGKQIEVTGTAFRSAQPVAGATSVIHVDALKVSGEACSATTAASKTASAGKTGGLSNGAKIGIAAAVVGGAAGGIIAATSKGSKSPQ